VGFGVSQALPVVVALLAASPGQIVYIEQPEIHRHPKAQTAMADLLVAAANRGVRVVAETHSALLLLAIQTALAKGKIAPSAVKLHWFQRDEQGCTKVTSVDPDEKGRFGDWPEDFATTELEAENRYLDAVEKEEGKVQNG
jgi:predicted ATPase